MNLIRRCLFVSLHEQKVNPFVNKLLNAFQCDSLHTNGFTNEMHRNWFCLRFNKQVYEVYLEVCSTHVSCSPNCELKL